MRARINHRNSIDLEKVDKNFWQEYIKRGFKVDIKNGGSYSEKYQSSELKKIGTGVYKLILKNGREAGFKIVPPKSFMKTVAQIEDIVRYKLFK